MMSAVLVVCAACERHVKSSDCVCPFCGAKVACEESEEEGERAPSRLPRAALLALGAAGVLTTSIAVASCAAAYGGPPAGGTDGAGSASGAGGAWSVPDGGTGGAGGSPDGGTG